MAKARLGAFEWIGIGIKQERALHERKSPNLCYYFFGRESLPTRSKTKGLREHPAIRPSLRSRRRLWSRRGTRMRRYSSNINLNGEFKEIAVSFFEWLHGCPISSSCVASQECENGYCLQGSTSRVTLYYCCRCVFECSAAVLKTLYTMVV